MAPTDIEASIAMTLVETVMIILPIWLAGIKYFIDDFDPETKEGNLFAEVIVLIYVSLAAVLVSSGLVVTDIGSDRIAASVYGLWLLFFATGAITLRFVEKKTTGQFMRYLLRFVIIVGAAGVVASFFLIIMASV